MTYISVKCPVCGSEKVYKNGRTKKYIEKSKHKIGKINTQRIERKNLTLRTRIKRLARKTICYSKTEYMHDIVIGFFINIVEFGLII